MIEENFYIDLLDYDIQYRGIQRNQNWLLNVNSKLSTKYINLLENERISFTIENIKIAKSISRAINAKSKKETNEVILFGKCNLENIKKNLESSSCYFNFLGFDITGDSLYISPIKTVFFEKQKNTISNECLKMFSEKLNDNGLFSSIEDVFSFLEYVNPHVGEMIEYDGSLCLVYVYKIT